MCFNYFLETSLFLQNWRYFLTAMLLFLLMVKMFQKRKLKQTNIQNNIRLDGEEYAAAQYTENIDSYQPSLKETEHVPYLGATVTLPGGAQQFYEMVSNRRSVRAFSQRTCDIAIIEKCIHAAATAPSGAHTEPWTFCLIATAEMKQKIRHIVEAEEYLNYNQRMHRQWTTDLKPLRTNHIKEYLTDAPYLMLVFKQIYGFVRGNDGQRKQHYYNEISVAIAIGIMLSALQAAGLNSLVTTPLNCGPVLRALLERPANEKLLVLLPVGYAAENCKVPDLQRKTIEEILIKY